MKCAEVIRYCRNRPDSQQISLNKSGTQVAFQVQGQIFAYFETGAPIQWQFTLRVPESLYEELHNPPRTRQAHKPGGLWITIVRVENYPEEELVDLIDDSYRRALELASAAA